MKKTILLTALTALAFASCKKADDQAAPQHGPFQHFRVTSSQGTNDDSTYFDSWATQAEEASAVYSRLSFKFKKKPDHSMEYKVVGQPAAEDEVRITAPDGTPITASQTIQVTVDADGIHLKGENLHASRSGGTITSVEAATDISYYTFNLLDR